MIKSVEQALNVLTYVHQHPNCSMSEIARALNLPTSTAHRMLGTLEEAGYVLRSGDRTFVGAAITHQRTDEEAVAHCVEVARPHMRALRGVTDETIHLATLRGSFVEFVAVEESSKQVRVSSKVGAQVPAGAAAAGKVLLAALSPEEFAASLPTLTAGLKTVAHPLTDPLPTVLASVRKDGFARNIGETEDGVYALAVPVRRRMGPVLCTLTITAPTMRLPALKHDAVSILEHSWLDELRRCALRIERALLY